MSFTIKTEQNSKYYSWMSMLFQKNSYPENFTDRCFKLFLNRIHILKEKVPTVQKKPLRLVLSYLGKMSLQNRTKFQKSIKGVTVVNYTLFTKFKIKSVIIFTSKALSGAVYKF